MPTNDHRSSLKEQCKYRGVRTPWCNPFSSFALSIPSHSVNMHTLLCCRFMFLQIRIYALQHLLLHELMLRLSTFHFHSSEVMPDVIHRGHQTAPNCAFAQAKFSPGNDIASPQLTASFYKLNAFPKFFISLAADDCEDANIALTDTGRHLRPCITSLISKGCQ